jgi:osmoprotectant transport system substrate-binding protein
MRELDGSGGRRGSRSMRRLRQLCLVVALCLLAACGRSESPTIGSGDKPKVIVGAKDNVTEDRLLGAMTAKLLAFKGIPSEYRELHETDSNRNALLKGQMSLYWEYTGTALTNFFKVEDVISDSQKAWQISHDRDLANGVVWLPPAPLNDANGLAVRSKDGIGTTLSDLASWMTSHPDTKWCILAAFRTRSDGMPQLKKVYGLDPRNVVAIQAGQQFPSLDRGDCDVIEVFTTDARLTSPKVTTLDDDKHALPVYNAAPTVRKQIADAYPNLADVLAPLTGKLDTRTMTALNGKVDVGLLPVDKVAQDFLVDNKLLS